MPMSEWCRMKSLKLAQAWLRGYNRRYRANYDIGKILAKVIAKGYCKQLPDGFPYTMPWDRTQEDDNALSDMSEEEQNELLESMKKSVLEKSKQQWQEQEARPN